jgi:hypothetical protein
VTEKKFAQGGVMLISEGLSPLTELVIWMSYAVTIVLAVLAVGILLEINKKE